MLKKAQSGLFQQPAADSATFDEAGACVADTPSSCRSASCCVEFVYDAYNFERECLGLLDEQQEAVTARGRGHRG